MKIGRSSIVIFALVSLLTLGAFDDSAWPWPYLEVKFIICFGAYFILIYGVRYYLGFKENSANLPLVLALMVFITWLTGISFAGFKILVSADGAAILPFAFAISLGNAAAYILIESDKTFYFTIYGLYVLCILGGLLESYK